MMRTYFTILSVLLLSACNSEMKQKTSQILSERSEKIAETVQKAEILKGFSVFVNSFELNASQGNSFRTSKGSTINVPSNAFRHRDGKPVSGKVKMTFKEYHTPGEVIASGIPMVYETPQGEKQQFESAGMFDIRAFQGEEALELAPGKKIEVDLVTFDPGSYNFYSFEDEKSNWKIEDTKCLPVKNPEIDKQAEALKEIAKNPVEKPKKPVAYKPSDKLFDIYVNLNKHPEFTAINGVMWKYTGTDPKSDPGNNPVVFQKQYDFVSMKPMEGEALIYELLFLKGKDSLKVQAAPVFQGALMNRKNAEFAAMMKDFNTQVARIAQMKEQNTREAMLLRKFSIDKLGIFNYDRQFNDEEAIPMLASFDFGGHLKEEEKTFINVYLIPSEKNAVIRYTPETYKLFALNPRENNKLLAILPDNSVFILADKDIRDMKLGAQNTGKKVVFRMRPYSDKVTAPQKLDEILASL